MDALIELLGLCVEKSKSSSYYAIVMSYNDEGHRLINICKYSNKKRTPAIVGVFKYDDIESAIKFMENE